MRDLRKKKKKRSFCFSEGKECFKVVTHYYCAVTLRYQLQRIKGAGMRMNE
jgi:hypothetical protein